MKLNKEEKWIATIAVLVVMALAIIIPARNNVAHQLDEAADSGYEAGYNVGFNEAKNFTVVETFELDDNTHIIVEFSDGEMQEYISPKALG